MRIDKAAADRFIQLYIQLIYFAGQVRKIIGQEESLEDFLSEPLAVKLACRDALYDPSPLIGNFITAYESALDHETRHLLEDWTRARHGSFIVYSHEPDHSIFFDTITESDVKPPNAYAVLSLTSELSKMVPEVPHFVTTALLPYQGKIVCDGFITGPQVHFPANIQTILTDFYTLAQSEGQIITQL